MKKDSDDKKPKRKPNSYAAFLASRYKQIKASNKNSSFTEISRMIADEWKSSNKNKKK
jgi:hypothetical protein